ncbi:ASKHA domain-containing protein [Desulfosarcina sp.]|uniref:ASKHA domain-containing protein n=1 Tax=Desulfosarcina sp. TaxID=2027861 RepID=UPI0029B8752E|nr:ASKHA domain-containing protein [Desulfosarcina sp.]MDX2455578.1 ASKHA domain-containing protein [Desulfosarcina sp.]MDX2493065.1 ASKHA domain-containing protein [Desulfosarcina sp.]
MGTCINHPDRETPYICMKHQIYLCEECLECRDPKIYCKHRSACPIWFMSKRKAGWEAEDKQAAATHTVTFLPDGRTVSVPADSTLLEAAQAAEIHVNASCSGKGSCGKCKLVVTSGEVSTQSTPLLTDLEKEKGYVLACQSQITGDVSVQIPEETLARKLKIAGMGQAVTDRLNRLVTDIDPMLQEIPLTLEHPSLDDSVSDLDRLNRGLKKQGCDVDRLNVGIKVMRQLTEVVRRDNWNITVSVVRRKCANEILEVRPGNGQHQSLGLAIDVGTTTIVVYLIDMSDGSVLAATAGHNRQADCGDDVINRIVCAEKDGVKKLSRMALATINDLIGEALDSVDAKREAVRNVVVSGNTTMAHLLLQIEPRYLRRDPYIPTVSDFPILKAGEIGLKANPMAAVFIMPGPASYVGGDIVSGILYTGFHREDPVTLFIDIGTNGEIVLGNKEWLMTAACSAGPAFEGGGIRWGMRAEEGAIEKVTIDPQTLVPTLSTVGDAPPRGICGSGMIDLIAELLKTGIVDRSGQFATELGNDRVRKQGDEWVYVLTVADETPVNEDIVFTASDLKNLIYSKGAVYAGFTTLLGEAGMDFSMVDRMIITGGFGQYLNIEKAVTIGLLPDIDRSRFAYMGNSSIVGAYMALLSTTYRQEARTICNSMTYVDFSSNPSYMDEFTSALFLPHTDLNAFPSAVAGVS